MLCVVFNFLINKKLHVISLGFFFHAFMHSVNLLCFSCMMLEGFTCAFMKVLHFTLRSQVQQIKIMFQWIQCYISVEKNEQMDSLWEMSKEVRKMRENMFYVKIVLDIILIISIGSFWPLEFFWSSRTYKSLASIQYYGGGRYSFNFRFLLLLQLTYIIKG